MISEESYDIVVVGAGTAGIPCAIHAAQGGARVLLVEKDARIGGTLHITGGHMAAGGTRRQAEHGIEDSPEEHLADIHRITQGTAREDLVEVVARRAPETIEWLQDRGFAFAPETPRIVYGHEPYTKARTYYGKDEGLSVLEVLEAELRTVTQAHDLTLWTQAPVTELLTADTGGSDAARVVGVSVLRGGTEVAVRAGSVVLATGGYGADPELFQELEGVPLVSAASRTSTGDGLYLGMAIGAGLQGEGTYLPSFGGLPDPQSPGRANWSDRQRLTSERAPWEIYVDRDGRRWVREDEESIDEKERALVGIPDQTFWTVFDDVALARATGTMEQMIVGKEPDQVRAVVDTRPGLHSADTLEELARKAGIDPAGLQATVARYNGFVAEGEDPDFGRTHLPAPIACPPFYALRNHAITLVTFTGLDIGADFAVRDGQGRAIPGLYAVGEVIGAGATCGNTFCSGMLMTPALTFGRLLGEALADR
ncbi:FAD-binding dehydrogenase [Nocardioides gansuensis]|uniref:FAD-binding dehydrogenase n=1 Tax=Nocardioides gansuensis TaxID=2138300 RepID=A0A2T8F4X9_9ACTN|nr:FAD-dependent oxidoreductase [Nocardioides gansuensis]PVG80778.1 FAD-binding dehydrogenase [Nocardioides gansuensis]